MSISSGALRVIVTDASGAMRRGAIFGGRFAQGIWNRGEPEKRIGWKELRASFRALADRCPLGLYGWPGCLKVRRL